MTDGDLALQEWPMYAGTVLVCLLFAAFLARHALAAWTRGSILGTVLAGVLVLLCVALAILTAMNAVDDTDDEESETADPLDGFDEDGENE